MAVLDTGVSFAAGGAMALTALGMVLRPGPNMIYLASRSISQGRAAGLISLAGTGVGFVVYLTMANLGLAVVFVAVPWLFIDRVPRSDPAVHRPRRQRHHCARLHPGRLQITVSMTINIAVIVVAGGIASFLTTRPSWSTLRRRITGTMLGLVAILLALEVPERARI